MKGLVAGTPVGFPSPNLIAEQQCGPNDLPVHL